MKKNLTKKARQWLNKQGATPVETEIYSITKAQFKKLKRPLQNGDIASVHKSHRTNIRAHLANMISKGLIKRHLHKFYLPVEA